MLGKEPTVILGALFEVVRAIVPTLIVFGLIHWTAAQVAQFVLSAGVVVGFLNVLFTRSQVTPVSVVHDLIETAIPMPATTTVEQVIAKQAAKDEAKDK